MFALNYRSCTTAKHLLLPYVELIIKLLNRLGHGVSYSKLEEIETALCLKKLDNGYKIGFILRFSTTLAFDNIDRLEETLSEGETSHRVNGIVIQPLYVHTVEAPASALTMPKQSLFCQILIPANVCPPVFKLLPIDCSTAVNCKDEELTWFIERLVNIAEQSVCDWTGFNIMTRDQTNIN